MKELRFLIEWADPMGAKGEELAATWASLRIMVGDVCVTRMSSTASSHSIRDNVQMPMYPLAEWVAFNWWHLLAEMQGARAGVIGIGAFGKRHNLRAAQEGFSLPDLTIVPTGTGGMKLEWRAGHLLYQEVRFIESGAAFCDPEQVKEELERFVTAVTDRLTDRGLTHTSLQKEWDAIVSADGEEQEFCRVAASLGLDPYALDSDAQDRLVEASERIGKGQLRDEFFAVADGTSVLRQTEELLRILDSSGNDTKQISGLSAIKSKVRSQLYNHGVQPWRMGYAYAQSIRKQMNGHGRQVFSSSEEILDCLGISRKEAAPLVTQYPFTIPINGAVTVNASEVPLITLRQGDHPDQYKFNFCRGFYEFLISGSEARRVITSARTANQQENKAFAAEFLVPSELLRAEVGSGTLYEEDVDAIARHFKVSPYVIRHQVTNHRIAELVSD